jgi:hypothetical protein
LIINTSLLQRLTVLVIKGYNKYEVKV